MGGGPSLESRQKHTGPNRNRKAQEQAGKEAVDVFRADFGLPGLCFGRPSSGTGERKEGRGATKNSISRGNSMRARNSFRVKGGQRAKSSNAGSINTDADGILQILR